MQTKASKHIMHTTVSVDENTNILEQGIHMGAALLHQRPVCSASTPDTRTVVIGCCKMQIARALNIQAGIIASQAESSLQRDRQAQYAAVSAIPLVSYVRCRSHCTSASGT
jgi:hypothetical protein